MSTAGPCRIALLSIGMRARDSVAANGSGADRGGAGVRAREDGACSGSHPAMGGKSAMAAAKA